MLHTLIKINRIQVPSRSYSSSKFVKKWLAIAENIDAAKQQLDFGLEDDRRGKMSEINYRTLKLTPSFISRKTKLPRSTSSDSWPAVIYSMRISMQLIASGASKHSLMPQSREFANVSNLRHWTSDKSSECTSILQSARRRHARLLWLLSIFNKIETLGKGNHGNSRKATSRVGRVCTASARLRTYLAIRKRERFSASSHPFGKIHGHARGR